MSIQKISLHGCTAEPLMGCLKALGVLRLVAGQVDSRATGHWHDGRFVFRSVLDEDALIRWFIETYRPTPIVVPWSGGDFFKVDRKGNPGPFKATPTASKIIECFLATAGPRLDEYRRTLLRAFSVLDRCGITEKKAMEDKKRKAAFLSSFRSSVEDRLVPWVDTCAVLADKKAGFNTLLGSGGGSDGNMHFSDNFMQNLWEVLPEFDVQRKGGMSSQAVSTELLRAALLDSPAHSLVAKRTSSLFDSGAVGGPNAGQGFDRVSLGNPWAFILCLEGTMALAGSVTRRHQSGGRSRSSFPFQARLTTTGRDSAVDKESGGREFWFPIWKRPAGFAEVAHLFAEGRATVGRKQVSRGVDFARAAASLGVDRGLGEFVRFAVVRGRVGGDNYNTASCLGHLEVRARADIDLLREIDPWLDRFRFAVSDDKAPPRFKTALRGIESAIFDFCRYGGTSRFTEILCALGRAEHELTTGARFRKEKGLRPLTGLSPDWLRAADDGSVELHLAGALAGISDPERKLGTIRENVEPVDGWSWRENDAGVVWTGRDLSANLSAILARRIMDGDRLGCLALPISSRRNASLQAIAAFLHGETDDARTAALLLGAMLISQTGALPTLRCPTVETLPLPRAFALLKLLFLPYPLTLAQGDIELHPEPAILAMLRAGRAGEACALAARRLRAAGLVPMTSRRGGRPDSAEEWWIGDIDPQRLAAALLIPINRNDAGRLAGLITRPALEARQAVT